MLKLSVFILALALSGCAKAPEKIVPAPMPPGAYQDLTCDQLNEEYRKAAYALGEAEKLQRQAVAGDTVGVVLIGIPVSSLSGGDIEGRVSIHKGEVIAIGSVQRAKGCPQGYIPPDGKPFDG